MIYEQVHRPPAHAVKTDNPIEGGRDPEQILLVDDDVELCGLIAEYLVQEGFEVTAVHDGRDGLSAALSGRFSLVILDVMLPYLMGFDVLRLLRKESNIPVIMLTARGEAIDRILGLEFGADDYLPKPVNPRELSARIHAVLRRAPFVVKTALTKTTRRIVVGDIELDPGSRSVWRQHVRLELTSVEFDILRAFLSAPARIVKREKLVKATLKRNLLPSDRSIDVHLSNLRRKLGAGPDGGERIKTIRGVGYVYAVASD
jgi:DNA-binding response OmpR family regulator